MTEHTIPPEDAGTRLDVWLARRPEAGSRSRARTWIERGKVFVNGVAVAFQDAGRLLRAGDRIGIWIDRPGSSRPRRREVAAARTHLRIVFEDAALLVADKPPGLLVEPLPGTQTGEVTLLDLVADHLRPSMKSQPLVVHRIDRDTSGLVVFAKHLRAWQALKAQFARRTPERVYTAVVMGRVLPRSGVWRDRLAWDKQRLIQKRAHPSDARAREAIARYQVVEQFPEAALMEISLVTGKRNQIRVQAGRRGHPLVGERVYTFGADCCPRGLPPPPRQALHAARLSFAHPETAARISVEAPLPHDLKRLIAALKTRPG